MKAARLLPVVLAGLFLVPASETAALDLVEARVRFNGTLKNMPRRQTVSGFFAGAGELKGIGADATVGGRVLTKAGERAPSPTLLGNYPVEVLVRVKKFGGSVSDTFTTTAQVRKGSIRLGDYGKVTLSRKINPRRPGTQRIRGNAFFRYRL